MRRGSLLKRAASMSNLKKPEEEDDDEEGARGGGRSSSPEPSPLQGVMSFFNRPGGFFGARHPSPEGSRDASPQEQQQQQKERRGSGEIGMGDGTNAFPSRRRSSLFLLQSAAVNELSDGVPKEGRRSGKRRSSSIVAGIVNRFSRTSSAEGNEGGGGGGGGAAAGTDNDGGGQQTAEKAAAAATEAHRRRNTASPNLAEPSGPPGSPARTAGGAPLAMHVLADGSGFDPEATKMLVWSTIVFVAIVVNVFVVPFRISFFPMRGYVDPLYVGSLACDAILVVNVFVSFHRGFYDDKGNKVLNPRLIRQRYVSNLTSFGHPSLVRDILSLLPLDVLELHNYPSWKLRGLLRTNRLLKLPRIFSLMKELIERRIGRHRLVLVRLTTTYLLVIHLIACGWYLFGVVEGFDAPNDISKGWRPQPWLDEDAASLGERYSVAVFRSLGMVTGVFLGKPTTVPQSAFHICVMIVSLLLFAYAIGAVATYEEAVSERSLTLQAKVQFVQHVLRSHSLPPPLLERVSAYLIHQALTADDVSNEVLEQLPEGLHSDVMNHVAGELLHRVTWLGAMGESGEGFIKTLAGQVRPVIFMRDEALISNGMSVTEIYFLVRGEAFELWQGKREKPLRKLVAGDYCGDSSFLQSLIEPESAVNLSAVSVVATKACHCLCLTDTAIKRVLEYFPAAMESITEQLKKAPPVVERRLSKLPSGALAAQLELRESRESGGASSSQQQHHHHQSFRSRRNMSDDSAISKSTLHSLTSSGCQPLPPAAPLPPSPHQPASPPQSPPASRRPSGLGLTIAPPAPAPAGVSIGTSGGEENISDRLFGMFMGGGERRARQRWSLRGAPPDEEVQQKVEEATEEEDVEGANDSRRGGGKDDASNDVESGVPRIRDMSPSQPHSRDPSPGTLSASGTAGDKTAVERKLSMTQIELEQTKAQLADLLSAFAGSNATSLYVPAAAGSHRSGTPPSHRSGGSPASHTPGSNTPLGESAASRRPSAQVATSGRRPSASKKTVQLTPESAAGADRQQERQRASKQSFKAEGGGGGIGGGVGLLPDSPGSSSDKGSGRDDAGSVASSSNASPSPMRGRSGSKSGKGRSVTELMKVMRTSGRSITEMSMSKAVGGGRRGRNRARERQPSMEIDAEDGSKWVSMRRVSSTWMPEDMHMRVEKGAHLTRQRAGPLYEGGGGGAGSSPGGRRQHRPSDSSHHSGVGSVFSEFDSLDETSYHSNRSSAEHQNTTELLRLDWKEEMRSELKAVFTRTLLKPVVELPVEARRQSIRMSRRFKNGRKHKKGGHMKPWRFSGSGGGMSGGMGGGMGGGGRLFCAGRLLGESRRGYVDRVVPLINPVSAFRAAWLFVLALAILATAFAAPYRIGFLPGRRAAPSALPWTQHETLLRQRAAAVAESFAPLEAACDVVFLIDTLLAFRLAYWDQLRLVVSPSKIRRRYLRSWLPINILALLALASSASLGYTEPWLRLLALAKVVQIPSIADELTSLLRRASRSGSSASFSARKLRNLLCLFLFMVHLTCAFYGASVGAGEHANERAVDGLPVAFEKTYWFCLWWTVGALSALGSISAPETVPQYVYSSLVLAMALFTATYLIGNIGVLIANIDSTTVALRKRRNAADLFARHQQLPAPLAKRLHRYMSLSWVRGAGKNLRQMTHQLNATIRADIMHHICNEVVMTVPLFNECEPKFISMLVEAMELEVYPQDEWVCHRGLFATSMYIVLNGSVSVVIDEAMMVVVRVLERGEFFGERALFGLEKRNASVQAKTTVDTAVLSAQSFTVLVESQPHMHRAILAAKERREAELGLALVRMEENKANEAIRTSEEHQQSRGRRTKLALKRHRTSCTAKDVERVMGDMSEAEQRRPHSARDLNGGDESMEGDTSGHGDGGAGDDRTSRARRNSISDRALAAVMQPLWRSNSRGRRASASGLDRHSSPNPSPNSSPDPSFNKAAAPDPQAPGSSTATTVLATEELAA